MYYIHSVGAAFGPTELTNVQLTDLGQNLGQSATTLAITTRRSILNLDYIKATKNVNLAKARDAALLSTAQLAKQAYEEALSYLAIEANPIEMLLADTLTPWQITPAESQRIGCEISLRSPSFDIGTSGVGLPIFFDLVMNWKASKAPNAIGLAIVNAPSLYIDYSKNSNAAKIFGDAAVSVLLGIEKKGFEILYSKVTQQDLAIAPFNFSINFHITENLTDLASFCENNFLAAWEQAASHIPSSQPITICASDFGSSFMKRAVEKLALKNIEILSVTDNYGDSIGCVSGLGLSQWSKLANVGEVFVGFSPGLGQQFGIFILRKI